MIRLFETHRIRFIQELDGMWNFRMEGIEKAYQLPVPGCWEQHPDFVSHRGKGTYSRKVYIKQDGNVRLEFKGVSHTGDIYFDGEKVAHHYNAFTPFSAVIKNVAKGEHEIKVLVDNTFGEYSALHTPNDYYTYGGITRPVALECVSDAYIRNVHFTPYLKDGKWNAKVEVKLCNLTGEEKQVEVESKLEGVFAEKSPAAGKEDKLLCKLASVTLQPNEEKNFVWEKEFENVQEWSHENPALYLLNTTLSVNSEIVDDFIERVGFRVVETDGMKLMVNGKAVRLRGFNRHEDYAEEGCAVSFGHMVYDMDIMQDLGVNALRTCHYPNDERFLDLCDERGIYVWEENHARGFVLERMQNPNFDKQCEDCIAEMIENHYNHPSIIIWGILNECASETDEGREKYARQYQQIKGLDATRPTTSATCRHFNDICLDLPDIVSFNIYSGWYENVPVGERNDKEIAWIQEAGGADKPIIVSEFGAGGIYGFRDRARSKWSEERQAEIIRDNLEVYLNDDRISGVFIWQFADCRVTEEEWFEKRPKTHNNKGVVDVYRRPKLAYDVVKEMFRADRA